MRFKFKIEALGFCIFNLDLELEDVSSGTTLSRIAGLQVRAHYTLDRLSALAERDQREADTRTQSA